MSNGFSGRDFNQSLTIFGLFKEEMFAPFCNDDHYLRYGLLLILATNFEAAAIKSFIRNFKYQV